MPVLFFCTAAPRLFAGLGSLMPCKEEGLWASWRYMQIQQMAQVFQLFAMAFISEVMFLWSAAWDHWWAPADWRSAAHWSICHSKQLILNLGNLLWTTWVQMIQVLLYIETHNSHATSEAWWLLFLIYIILILNICTALWKNPAMLW